LRGATRFACPRRNTKPNRARARPGRCLVRHPVYLLRDALDNLGTASKPEGYRRSLTGIGTRRVSLPALPAHP
jgi:hypothetical protein